MREQKSLNVEPAKSTLYSSTMSRRECLSWLARAAAAAVAVDLCAHRMAAAGETGAVKIADLLALPNESAKIFEKQNLILTRTSSGVAGLTIYCTHRHNKLEVESGAITCPVHGSNFDFDGKPLNGPANRALQCYLTRVDEDGAIWVDTSKSVKTGQFGQLPSWARPAGK